MILVWICLFLTSCDWEFKGIRNSSTCFSRSQKKTSKMIWKLMVTWNCFFLDQFHWKKHTFFRNVQTYKKYMGDEFSNLENGNSYIPTSRSSNKTIILLMEEILHHPGCIKPCKEWDKLPTSTGQQDFGHQYIDTSWGRRAEWLAFACQAPILRNFDLPGRPSQWIIWNLKETTHPYIKIKVVVLLFWFSNKSLPQTWGNERIWLIFFIGVENII